MEFQHLKIEKRRGKKKEKATAYIRVFHTLVLSYLVIKQSLPSHSLLSLFILFPASLTATSWEVELQYG